MVEDRLVCGRAAVVLVQRGPAGGHADTATHDVIVDDPDDLEAPDGVEPEPGHRGERLLDVSHRVGPEPLAPEGVDRPGMARPGLARTPRDGSERLPPAVRQ